MPLQATSGAASYDAFGGGVAVEPVYIEQIFSTFLYTGNGTSQTITNGVDLLGKGGLVWIKSRMPFDASGGVTNHNLITNPAAGRLQSNTTAALGGFGGDGFTSTGFQVSGTVLNSSTSDGTPPNNYASWTFRKQKKFFDVVTWTGNGVAGRQISHSLGSVPACIIVKGMETTNNWPVYHQSLGNTKHLNLNTTDSQLTSDTWNNTSPTATEFTIGSLNNVNQNGYQFVAYLFAHDAGGFGLTGTDNVISCGSFTCPSSGGVDVNLGYEPQWILTKKVNGSENWNTWDTMRGWALTQQAFLAPNNSNAEVSFSGTDYFFPTATGFRLNSSFGLIGDYIYIAIRRGPMKVPTSGTSVFNTVLWTGNQTNNRQITGVGFNPDFVEAGTRSAATTFDRVVVDRLRGTGPYLVTYATQIEQANSDLESFDNDGITVDYVSSGAFNNNSNIYGHFFKRAPSFFDVVCYTGTGSARTITHNLAAVPELMIVKCRSTARAWPVYAAPLGNTEEPRLNESSASGSSTSWNSTTPTSSVFSVSNGSIVNASGDTYVAYLFATCAGVSKVTTFTGNGSSQTINCGFTGGARFVLIKRVDSTGNWVTFDTARGISSGNDPALYLNSTAAEVTGVDAIDPDSTGFIVNQESTFNLNVSSATYLVLAIA